MANIYTGIAVIDRKLQIAKADEQFYEFIGSENYASVAGNIWPGDIEYVKQSVKNIREEESMVFLIRLRNAQDEEYHHVLTELNGLAVSDGQESYVEMRIQDIDQLNQRFSDICDENALCNEFLELWGERLFIYDKKHNVMQMFNGGSKNRIYTFRGTLDAFKDHIYQEKMIAEKDFNAFEELCDNIMNGVKNFEGKMLFLNDGIDPEQNIHLVKGRTIQNSKGDPIVLGYLSLRNLQGTRTDDNTVVDFETDITTGLLTKKAILNYTENLLHRKPKYNVNLCVIDIDNFKAVNDTLGHMFGDEVLAKVAGIIKDAVEGKGIVGRIGGDEMFVVLEGVNTLSDLRGVLRSIRNNVEWAYLDRKEVPKVTCSIGVSTYPTDSAVYDDLFKIADKMLYRAKQKGKNRYIIYAPEVHGDVLNGESEAVIQNTAAARQDKEDLVLKLLEFMARQTNRPFYMILQDIGLTFGLDEVSLIYGDEKKTLLESYWCSDGSTKPADSDIHFVHEENFVHLYREHNLAVIDKLDLIEQLCPQTHKYMTEHGIKTALIYKMNYKQHEGYITYYKRSDMSRKWSDSDLANLTYISKIMELVINDR